MIPICSWLVDLDCKSGTPSPGESGESLVRLETYLEGVCVRSPRDNRALCHHGSPVIGVVTTLKEPMPVDGQGLIAELVVHIDNDSVIDGGPDGGTRPLPIDGDNRSMTGQCAPRKYIGFCADLSSCPSGFAVIQLMSQSYLMVAAEEMEMERKRPRPRMNRCMARNPGMVVHTKDQICWNTARFLTRTGYLYTVLIPGEAAGLQSGWRAENSHSRISIKFKMCPSNMAQPGCPCRAVSVSSWAGIRERHK